MFRSHPDPFSPRDASLSDCLMSGLAVFSLRMPSLLQFDKQVRGQAPGT